jgi:hypothetical protein
VGARSSHAQGERTRGAITAPLRIPLIVGARAVIVLGSNRFRLLLRLYGVSGSLPATKASHEGMDVGESVLVQFQRRTGAGLFGRSSTVENNLGVFWQFWMALIYLEQGHRDGACDVTGLIRGQ